MDNGWNRHLIGSTNNEKINDRGHVMAYEYSGTSIYRFSRDRRKQTMNAGKRSIRETITHYTLRGAFKF